MGGYRLSTSKVYKSIQQGFISFCNQHNLSPLPLTEQLILRYIAFKAPSVGSRSFNVYLAAIRALHTPPPSSNTPHIKLALKSLELQSSGPNRKSPITIQQLINIMAILPK